jgi:uncharacterized protein (TIGR03435 family)
MHDAGDMELLREYDRQGSEAAFAALVQRHVSLVYSAALRHVGIAAHAEEITQAVFIILARKAASLRPDTILEGWLYETTRLTALSFRRGERRRQFREQEAYMQSTLQESADASTWNQLAPLLDEAMTRLGKKDRDAVVLRFFKDKNLREVAAALKVNETAAQRRVHRAVEKLRRFFTKRGIILPAAVLTTAISANSVQAAPVALAKTVTAVAVAKGAAAGGSTLILIKGALKIMAWTKMKTAIVASAVVLLAAGTTTVTVKEIENHNEDKWDTAIADTRNLDKAPHIVKIILTKFADQGGAWARGGNRIIGVGANPKQIILAVYGGRETRTIFLTPLSQKKYDFMGNLSSGTLDALKELVKKQFNAAGRAEIIETNVLFLRVKQPDAPGLKKTTNQNGTSSSQDIGETGEIHLKNGTMSDITDFVENQLDEIPVIDQTTLRRNFDADLVWDRKTNSNENLKQALTDQLGLELVPGTAPVEFLIVEKAP